MPGAIGEDDGKVKFAERASAKSYDVADEIAGRAMLSGARVLGVRKDDLPAGGQLAALLGYPL